MDTNTIITDKNEKKRMTVSPIAPLGLPANALFAPPIGPPANALFASPIGPPANVVFPKKSTTKKKKTTTGNTSKYVKTKKKKSEKDIDASEYEEGYNYPLSDKLTKQDIRRGKIPEEQMNAIDEDITQRRHDGFAAFEAKWSKGEKDIENKFTEMNKEIDKATRCPSACIKYIDTVLAEKLKNVLTENPTHAPSSKKPTENKKNKKSNKKSNKPSKKSEKSIYNDARKKAINNNDLSFIVNGITYARGSYRYTTFNRQQ
jgi:hypothetical protein